MIIIALASPDALGSLFRKFLQIRKISRGKQFRLAAPLHTLKVFRTVGDPPITGAEVAEVFLRSNKRLKTGHASS